MKTKIKALAIGLICLPVFMANASNQAPNVLFIAVDDLKPLLGSYGNLHIDTPNLDKLSNEGVMFTNAHAQYPVCGPSRMSLLTGTRPETNGIMNLKSKIRDLQPDIVTLPQLFKQNGYQTAAVGKVFDPRNVKSRKEDDPISWSIPYQEPKNKLKKSKYAVASYDEPEINFVDGVIIDQAQQRLNSMLKTDKPFFLAVGFKKPHLPFVAPKQYFDIYNREELPLASFQQVPLHGQEKFLFHKNTELKRSYKTKIDTETNHKYQEGPLTKAQQQELLHGYYASVSFIDKLVGDLLQSLEDTGMAKNTIVVLWGDHGFHLGDHGLWGKHTTMEQATRVPLIIKLPGQNPRVYQNPVELLDLYPTLASLAGLPMPKILEGDDLTPVLTDKTQSIDKVAISQYRRGKAYGYSMRTNKYRYTEWIDENKKVLYRDLYDLQSDPLETINIIDEPQFKDTVTSLAAKLRQNKQGLNRL